MTQYWLTTKDNPFDPFDEFEDWKKFDEQNGYFTLNLVARLCRDSDEMTEEMQNDMCNQAIDDILKYVQTGFYEKVVREV